MKRINLSVVIPTINSAEIIEKNLALLSKILSDNPMIEKYEVIVAAQTSRDETFDVLKRIKSKNIKVLFIKEIGKGLGLTVGFKKAKYGWILMIDDDLPYDLNNFLNKSLIYLNNYDIIIGSRYIKKIKQSAPIGRKIASFCYRKLVNGLFKIPQKDPQAGIKLTKKIIFDKIKYPSQKGYTWDTELLYYSNKKGLKIKEVPLFLKQKSNKLRISKDSLKMLRDLLNLYFKTK